MESLQSGRAALRDNTERVTEHELHEALADSGLSPDEQALVLQQIETSVWDIGQALDFVFSRTRLNNMPAGEVCRGRFFPVSVNGNPVDVVASLS